MKAENAAYAFAPYLSNPYSHTEILHTFKPYAGVKLR